MCGRWGVDAADNEAMSIAVSVLGNLVGYPHGSDAEVRFRTGMGIEEVEQLVSKVVQTLRAARR